MAIWPSDGIALAMMLGRFRHRPLTVLLLNEVASALPGFLIGDPGGFIILLKIADTILLFSLYLALKKYNYERDAQKSKNIVILFSSSLIGSLIVSIVQTYFVSLYYKIIFLPVFLSDAAANWTGYALLTPIFLIMTRDRWRPHALSAGLREFAVIVVYTTIIWLVLDQNRFPALFVVPLALIAVAYTTRLAPVAVCLLVTSLICIYATISGVGPMSKYPGTPMDHLFMTQVVLGVITASCLPIAAMMAEHGELKTSLVAARLDAEAASRAKSNFLATMSHEVRTPLNGILGMAQIMSGGPLEPAQAERLQIVQRSGEMLLSILNDVLDLAKIEAGKIELESIAFDLAETLTATKDVFEPLATAKGLGLHLDIVDVKGLFRGDPTRIRQIVSNLISNALKFTETGSVSVSASHDGGWLRLCVEDTGIGIAADNLGQLFSKFVQADQTTTRRFGGTGLGLAICRDLASLMGGDIEVKSVLGQGSTFTASLPLERIGEAAAKVLGAPMLGATRLADGQGEQRIKVLAAEDNATNQMVLRAMLECAGMSVAVVDNGAEALRAWERETWHVILMDVQMPVMDGPTAARTIRTRELAQGRERTPIIALTADTMSHQVKFHLESGMDLHVSKPIDAADLFQKILKATQLSAPNETAADLAGSLQVQARA